jgi:hypothetical protein
MVFSISARFKISPYRMKLKILLGLRDVPWHTFSLLSVQRRAHAPFQRLIKVEKQLFDFLGRKYWGHENFPRYKGLKTRTILYTHVLF